MGFQVHERGQTLYRYRFGTAEFDEGRFELRVAGRLIGIQRRPLEVLTQFLRRPGEVVTRNELVRAVWHDRPTRPHVIHAALTRLRSALGHANAEHIVTVARVGYRLRGSVDRVAVGRHFTGSLALDQDGVVCRRESFVLVSRLGRAPNHEVWLARDVRTGEPRVYKFSADGEGLAALKREATFARILRRSLGQRQDLVQLLDWNFAAAPFFLEYQYAGVSLLEWAARNLASLAIEQRLELFLHAADAVAASHSVGVLHEDLKPANLLISERANRGWQVCLTDFGSARLLDAERLQGLGITQLDATVSDGVMSDGMATLLYVAPERLTGGAASAQSDVFSLGILLYQLVVGDLRRPLMTGWEREVPDELLREDIIAATEGNPAFRLPSVSALVDRLRGGAARRRELALGEGTHRDAVRPREVPSCGRAPRFWTLATFLCLTLGLALGLGLYWRTSLDRARSSMTTHCEALIPCAAIHEKNRGE